VLCLREGVEGGWIKRRNAPSRSKCQAAHSIPWAFFPCFSFVLYFCHQSNFKPGTACAVHRVTDNSIASHRRSSSSSSPRRGGRTCLTAMSWTLNNIVWTQSLHCLCRSVKGTYRTPNCFSLVTLPSASLSTCQMSLEADN
jgi:hypothetical protein